jgi:hypothetical protein
MQLTTFNELRVLCAQTEHCSLGNGSKKKKREKFM